MEQVGWCEQEPHAMPHKHHLLQNATCKRCILKLDLVVAERCLPTRQSQKSRLRRAAHNSSWQ